MEQETKLFSIFLSSDYQQVLNICERADAVDCLYTYEMPNKAISYLEDFSRENVNSLIETLNTYHTDEEWRVRKDTCLQLELKDKELKLANGLVIKDVARLIFMPEAHSLILVPGEETIKSGVKPNLIFRFRYFLSTRLFLLDMSSHTEEDGSLKLDLVWKETVKTADSKDSEPK